MPIKVLLVDDARASRMIVGKIVKKLGHEIIAEAENGELGFEAYKEFKPDLVLSDVEMPVLNGYEMVKKIVQFDSNANIVMITSVVNAQIIQKILLTGAIDALRKPINDKKLKKIFDELEEL